MDTLNAFIALPLLLRLTSILFTGLLIGSAVNWAVFRLAWNKRPIGPWSPRLPEAQPRGWLDWLPIVGWFAMRREVSLHGRGFWIRPMLLELITAAGFLGIYCWETLAGGLLPDFARGLILKPQLQAIVHCQCLAHLVLFSFMMAATWIDIDEKTIPDGITLPGSLLGLILITWLPQALLPDVQVSASGALTIGNVVWLFTPLLPGGRNRLCMPALGHKGLALGLVCIWFWVYAMLPRTWYTRHGLFRAVRLMVARLLRQTMTYVLLLLGVAESVAVYLLWRSPVGPQWFSLLSSLVGMGFGAALVWMVRVLGKWALKREAMGFGDVTLMAMIGVYVGWQPVVLIFFLAPFAGVVIGGANFLLHGEVEIPYGPFLCLATMVTIIGWVPVWDFTVNYFSLGWLLPVVLMCCLSLIVVLLPLVRWGLDLVGGKK